jgi:hypothetical protein
MLQVACHGLTIGVTIPLISRGGLENVAGHAAAIEKRNTADDEWLLMNLRK